MLWLVAVATHGQPSVGDRRTIKQIEAEVPVPKDFVRFTNGDVLTGDVERIEDGAVKMKPEMAEDSLTIPVEAVKEVVFRDREDEGSFPGDRLILVNGESLVARVERMRDGKVSLLLPSSQVIEMDAGNVAAVAFYRPGEVLAHEDFDSGPPEGMQLQGGRWRTQRGWLLQAESREPECYAVLPVPQTGELIYEWTVNTTVGGSTGFYFLASDPGLSQTRAYFVRLLRKYVIVYNCINGEQVYCGSYGISLYKSRNEVRLRCDSGQGLIEMWIDGTEVGRWRASSPIKLGRYVILRADGRAAFDNLRIVRVGGAERPDVTKDQEQGDALKLVNGDLIGATVKGISERLVSFAADGVETASEIEREKLLHVRLERKLEPLPRGVNGTVVIVSQGGERISGELSFVQGGIGRIESDLVGFVDLRRRDIKKVIFREFP